MDEMTFKGIISKYNASQIEETEQTTRFLIPWANRVSCYRELEAAGIHSDCYVPMSGCMNQMLFVVRRCTDD